MPVVGSLEADERLCDRKPDATQEALRSEAALGRSHWKGDPSPDTSKTLDKHLSRNSGTEAYFVEEVTPVGEEDVRVESLGILVLYL
jgi:hypothetical protein